jgi:hypothetical protein
MMTNNESAAAFLLLAGLYVVLRPAQVLAWMDVLTAAIERARDQLSGMPWLSRRDGEPVRHTALAREGVRLAGIILAASALLRVAS